MARVVIWILSTFCQCQILLGKVDCNIPLKNKNKNCQANPVTSSSDRGGNFKCNQNKAIKTVTLQCFDIYL